MFLRTFKYLFLACTLLLTTGYTYSQTELPDLDEKATSVVLASSLNVPPGFESLAEEQVTEIDIYFGGTYLLSTLASFNSEHVTIMNPAVVVSLLPNLINPIELQELLSLPLSGNEHLVCQSAYQIDCGLLETESVQIIFDRSKLQLWLFLSPSYLSEALSVNDKYLGNSTANFSYMNNSNLFFSARDLDFSSYSLVNNLIISHGVNRFTLKSFLAIEDGIDFDEASLKREFRGLQYSAGLFRPSASNFRFQNNDRVIGLEMSSSLSTRVDLQNSQGTEIQLYLPTRSRVEILRDGIVLDSNYYELGNQILDTATLPNGSYRVDIRITDIAGNISNESYFYSKSVKIPPKDQSMFFFQVGKLYENNRIYSPLLPEDSAGPENYVVRGGITKRLGDTASAGLGLSLIDDISLFETSLYKQLQNSEVQFSASLENTGASAVDVNYRYNTEYLSFNLNALKIFNSQEYGQLGTMKSQIGSSFDIRTKLGSFSLFYRSSSNMMDFSNNSYGFRYRGNSFSSTRHRWAPAFEMSRNNGELMAFMSISYNLQGERSNSNFNPQLSLIDNVNTAREPFTGSWQTRFRQKNNLQNSTFYTFRADMNNNRSLLGRYETERNWGRADISARYFGNTSSNELSGNFTTGFIGNYNSQSVGNSKNQNSGVRVKVKGEESQQATFDIYVDNIVKATVQSGKSVFVPLPPYESYKINIQATGNELVTVTNKEYRETLYPGNVVDLEWEAISIVVVIAQIRNENGEVLADALISNAQGLALTDNNGYFQAELDRKDNHLLVKKAGFECSAELPSHSDNKKQVVFLGTLICH